MLHRSLGEIHKEMEGTLFSNDSLEQMSSFKSSILKCCKVAPVVHTLSFVKKTVRKCIPETGTSVVLQEQLEY